MAMDALPDLVKIIFGESGIVIACFVAVFLNILIPPNKSMASEIH